jgi:hypothetical protein
MQKKCLALRRERCKISVVGNGKVALSLLEIWLALGFHPSQIIIIRREESESDFSWFVRQGIKVSLEMSDVVNSTHICLVVTPDATGDILFRLKNVELLPLQGYKIVNMVSGCDNQYLAPFIRVPHRIVRATCNTNVAHGSGIVCASENSILFEGLGTTFIEPASTIELAVPIVGSGNGICYKNLIISFKERGKNDMSFFQWLFGLRSILRDFNFNLFVPVGIYHTILSSLQVMGHNFTAGFRRPIPESRQKCLQIFLSAVETLLLIGPDVTIDDAVTLMKKAITKNGCTEKGIGKVELPSHITSFDYMWNEAWSPILAGANNFRSIAKESILTAQKKVLLS